MAAEASETIAFPSQSHSSGGWWTSTSGWETGFGQASQEQLGWQWCENLQDWRSDGFQNNEPREAEATSAEIEYLMSWFVTMQKGFLKFSSWERQVALVRHTRYQVKKKNPYRKPKESSSLCVLVRAGQLHKQFSWKCSYRIQLLSSPTSPSL